MRWRRCFIVRRRDEQRIEAELRPSTHEDGLRWAQQWAPRWSAAASEDAHWDWAELIQLAESLPSRFACYSLLADGRLQGLRLLEVSEDEVDLYGTHALRLSTAPWNRSPELEYRGVGSLLVAAGLLRSRDDGHGGCMHCSSLPVAERFHERNGMARLGLVDEEGLARYHFVAGSSHAFLTRLSRDGYLEAPSPGEHEEPREPPARESWEDQISAAQTGLEARDGGDQPWMRGARSDVASDDHLWDTGAAASLDVLAHRIPATTRGSTLIVGGRVRHKQRPVAQCPDCAGSLEPATVSIRFDHAPAATAVQSVPGHRCTACGSEWPEPSAMRSAHADAFIRP